MATQLQVLFLAMTPINELRGTIPVALAIYQMTPWQVFIWAVIGNIIPVFFLLLFWKYLANFLMERIPIIKKFFQWLFERTRKKFYKKYSLYGNLTLILFVALPFPITGAWTGSLAAYLFGIKYWQAIGLIFIGVLIAGIIVTTVSVGALSIIGL